MMIFPFQMAVDEAEREAKKQLVGDEAANANVYKSRPCTYECSTRHRFQPAEDATMLRQMGEPKLGDFDDAPVSLAQI